MVFSAHTFLFVFLPLVLLAYFSVKPSFRNGVLLAFSLVFYAWGEPKFILLMLVSILINYLAGLLIDRAHDRNRPGLAKLFLTTAIVLNLSLLGYFKYLNFFINSINHLVGTHVSLPHIVLPIGISFYTFQAMSYIIDLYRRQVPAQKNPFSLALYISLFPQLVAGPIVRYADIQNRIISRHVSLDDFATGIRRFIIGLAKKIIIANQMAIVADGVFALSPLETATATAWWGILCYALQIYFDFSGYSDMAIGLGRMFGFHFLENFNYPYISKSITEFWRRWHISLSTWFRDYVYIPLGGNRTGHVYRNLIIVFLITGLWHGAAWNFVIWGLWHGMFLLIERFFRSKGIAVWIPKPVQWGYTLLIVLIGWVLFRAPDLPNAARYIGVMFGICTPADVGFSVFWYLTRKSGFIFIVACIAALPWKTNLGAGFSRFRQTRAGLVLDRVSVLGLLAISLMLLMTSTHNPFIYFRF